MVNKQPTRVLMVCLGNICRSPTAEAVFRSKAAALGLAEQFQFDSAGTAAWHIGKSPDSRSQQAAVKRGYQLQRLRARQVTAADFAAFDMVLAMDEQNLANLQALQAETKSKAKLELVLHYANNAGLTSVPDPYYGGDDGFNQVLDLLESAAEGFFKLQAS